MIDLAELSSWVSRGWAIFPCHTIIEGACSCADLDCGSPGKHPRISNGVKGATRDLDQVKSWRERFGDSNWAVATGERSGIWVLDIDKHKHDGGANFNKWISEVHFTMPPTFVVSTGGGGWHYYFSIDAPLRNRTNVLLGVDVRADGGYVLLPGSAHMSGRTYSVAREGKPALADQRLMMLVTRPVEKVSSAGDSRTSLLDAIPEGERDDTLFRMACSLRRKLGGDRRLVTHIVLEAARASGFPEVDALRKVQSAFEQDHSDVYPDLFTPTSRLGLQSAVEVRTRPRPDYLVQGVLPEGALFQVFGQTGSFKSFVMLDLLASVANGLPWMGNQVASPGPVAFVLGEGGYDAGIRVEAWMKAHPKASDDHLVYSIEEQLDLMNEPTVDAIIEDLEAYRLAHFEDQSWKIIVFDTQADHMPSGDEDKSRDFTVIKRAIQRIAHATGAAVGLVHHTGWDDSRERGSSRQRQALDVVIQVKNQRITNIKQKAGPLFDPISFTTESSGDSIFVQKLSPIAAASVNLDADLEVGRRVLTYLFDHSGASQNEIQRELNLGRSGTWPSIRDVLDKLGYLEVTKDTKGSVRSVSPTVRGLAFYGIGSDT